MKAKAKQNKVETIIALKDTFIYKVSVTDFINTEKSKVQMNAYNKAFNQFEIAKEPELKNVSEQGETFIALSAEKSKAFYQTFKKSGSVLAYVLFNSRQETMAFEQELKRIRLM